MLVNSALFLSSCLGVLCGRKSLFCWVLPSVAIWITCSMYMFNFFFVRMRLCFELKYVYSLFSSEQSDRRLFLVLHQLSVLCFSTFENLKSASFLSHRTFVQLPCAW